MTIPPEHAGVSGLARRRGAGPRGAVWLLVAGLLWPTLPQAQSSGAPAPALRLPSLGESASDEFNLGTEKRLGEQIMKDIRRDPDYLDDPQLLDYLQSIWQPLVQAAVARGDIGPDTQPLFPYEAFLVRDRTVNAFALPGGYVGVHLGLMAVTGSRDELASVLAHELSHITQRHIARSVTANARNATLGMAATILAVLAAARSSNIDAANAALYGGQAAVQQAQLNFSRDMEREADRNGIGVMTEAGFSPAGMAAMFERLDQANRLNDNGSYPYLRSHPLTTDRIGEARARVGSLPGAGTAGGAPLLHLLMQARARVLMDPSTQTLTRLQPLDGRADLSTLPLADRLVGLYTGALASLQLRDLARAELATSRALALLVNTPGTGDAAARRALERLAAQVALARGDLPRARLALAGEAPDGSRAGLLLRAQLALADGQESGLRGSAEALQTWLAEHRQDASAWLLLSQNAQRLGQPLRAVRAEAEAQAAVGDLRGAIDRLRAGQSLARRGGQGTDFIEASVIDARLRDLSAQRRDQQIEQRRNGGPEND